MKEKMPDWIVFDSTTGTIELIDQPKISEKLEIKIIATDEQGNTEIIIITLSPEDIVDEGEAEEAPLPEDVIEEGEEKAPDEQTRLNRQSEQLLIQTAGRPGLTEQLNQVGSKGFEQHRLKLLSALKSVADEKNAA